MAKAFQIENIKSGVILGVYEADTEAEALEQMAQNAGYASYEEACDVAAITDSEILVSEVVN